MNGLKRNQVIIFVIALMLVSAGYLSYTANNQDIATSGSVNSVEDVAALGDAKLVNSNVVIQTNTDEAVVPNDNLNTDINTNIEKENNTASTYEAISTSNKETDEYFSSSKLTRDTMYSQMLETYEKILSNEKISADQKTIAQTEIKNINDTKNRIMICENLIKTKDIQDIVIFVNGDSVSVIVKSDNLGQEQIAQIQNIITREMQVDIDNIHISNK